MAIQGALAAVSDKPDLYVILVGPSDQLQSQLAELGRGRDKALEKISVHHASEVITMHDSVITSYSIHYTKLYDTRFRIAVYAAYRSKTQRVGCLHGSRALP